MILLLYVLRIGQKDDGATYTRFDRMVTTFHTPACRLKNRSYTRSENKESVPTCANDRKAN